MPQQPPLAEIQQLLQNCIAGLRGLMEEAGRAVPLGAAQADHWQTILANLENSLTAGRFRAAVVGTVKSGKSTLVNALLGRDVLKRGAGIVTAMMTRIEAGDRPRAILEFKDWDEVNGELNAALNLFPSPILLERGQGYDIRREEDRSLLTTALAQVDPNRLLSQDMMDTNYILVQSFLQGYPEVARLLGSGQQRLELGEPDLAWHQQMVTHDAQAVFLKDVRLFLPFPWPAPGLELGDCQGSDSPIPQHLAQVHNYLLGTDLVIYVVSARVGLRQADYKFLAELKRLRLWKNAVVVFNLDLNELEDLGEAQRLVQRWQGEMAAFQEAVPVFAFSALDLLLIRLRQAGVALSPKDLGKLMTWEGDADLTAFSRQEAARFETFLQQTLATRQQELLLQRSTGHLALIVQGMRERLLVQEKLLLADVHALQDNLTRLRLRRESLERLLHSLSQALQGAAAKVKQGLRRRLDAFGDARHGDIGPLIRKFIEDDTGELDRLELGGQLSAFLPGLYLVYQGFQQRLLRFLTEEINLRILEFVRQQEDWLQEELSQVLEPLLVSLQDALNLYYQEISSLGIDIAAPTITLAPWKKPDNLRPELFSLELRLNMRLRSQAMARFGVNLVAEAMARLKSRWRKQPAGPGPDRLRASLGRALEDIKAYTIREMADGLLSYTENLKFQYFFPLVDNLSGEQEKALNLTLAALLLDLEGLQEVIGQQSRQRELWQQRLQGLLQRLAQTEAGCLQPLGARLADFSQTP